MSSAFKTDLASPPNIPSKSRFRSSIFVSSKENPTQDLNEISESSLNSTQIESSSSVFTRSDLEVSDIFSGKTYSEMSTDSLNKNALTEGISQVNNLASEKDDIEEQSSDGIIDLTEEVSIDLQNSTPLLTNLTDNLPSPVKISEVESNLSLKAKSSDFKPQKNSFQDVRKKFMEKGEQKPESVIKNSPSPLLKNRLSLNTKDKFKSDPKSPTPPNDIKPLNKSRFSFSEKDKDSSSGSKDYLKKDALTKRASLTSNLVNSPFTADLKGSLKKTNVDILNKPSETKFKKEYLASPIKDKFPGILGITEADSLKVKSSAQGTLNNSVKNNEAISTLPTEKSTSSNLDTTKQDILEGTNLNPAIKSEMTQSLEKADTSSDASASLITKENGNSEFSNEETTKQIDTEVELSTLAINEVSNIIKPEVDVKLNLDKSLETKLVIADKKSQEISNVNINEALGEQPKYSVIASESIPVGEDDPALLAIDQNITKSQVISEVKVLNEFSIAEDSDLEKGNKDHASSSNIIHEEANTEKFLEVTLPVLSKEDSNNRGPISPQLNMEHSDENVAVFEDGDVDSVNDTLNLEQEQLNCISESVEVASTSHLPEPTLENFTTKFKVSENNYKMVDSEASKVGATVASPEPITNLDTYAKEEISDPVKLVENTTSNNEYIRSNSNLKHTARTTSTVSYSSQTSQESQRSDNGILNKVRSLYGIFQAKPDSAVSSQNSAYVGSLPTTSNIPRRLSDTPVSPPPIVLRGKSHHTSRSLPNEADELDVNTEKKTTDSPPHSIHLQSIPKHMRRISLMDVTPPSESRAASLYSVEDLDADNVDWDFWGQLINNFEPMMKSQRTLVQRNIREGIPVSMRGMVWQLLSNIRSTNLLDTYSTLLTKTSPYEKKIIQDLPRTFPNLAYFKSKEGSGQESLFNVLKCYSIYDSHVGYCQGLSFLAGPLLLNMPDEEAFCVLVKIMEGLRQHYTPAMEGLQVRTYQFERLMEEKLPELYKHFQEQDIQSTMYVSQWFLTLFAYRSSMKMVFRVLDMLLLEGGDILVKVALALLIENIEEILALKFDDLISYLKSGIFDNHQNRIDKLMNIAVEMKLPERRMAKWSREYLNELSKRAEEEAYAASLQGVNQQLMASNKELAAQVEALSASGRDISGQLGTAHSQIHQLETHNNKLEMHINELEVMLHTERQRAEAALRDEMELLAQKNLSLVNKNATLEDALSQAEDSLISLKSKYSA